MSICCRERRVYPSDVTDAEWAMLEPLIPAVKPGGRPEEIERREIVKGTYTSNEAFIYLAMTRIMVARLAHAHP